MGGRCVALLTLTVSVLSCVPERNLNNPFVVDEDGDGVVKMHDCDDSNPQVAECGSGEACDAGFEQCGGAMECVEGVCGCSDPKYTGADCAECSDPRFTGADCDECSAKFTGADCDECSDADFPVTNGQGCVDSTGQWAYIAAGSFTMGSSESDDLAHWDEFPSHKVTLTRAFAMQTSEVTQSQWQALMGNNPSEFDDCPSCPVERMNWYEALAYRKGCRTLNESERMPSFG